MLSVRNHLQAAYAAIVAVLVAAFLPALHAVPGLEHDCASKRCCESESRSSCDGHERRHSGCGHARSHRAKTDVALKPSSTDRSELRAETGGESCLLCSLFQSFVWASPEQGEAPEFALLVSALGTLAPSTPLSSTSARRCRGPPAGGIC